VIGVVSGWEESQPDPNEYFFDARATDARRCFSARGVRVQAWMREMLKGFGVVGVLGGDDHAEGDGGESLSLNSLGEEGREGQRVRE